MSDKIQLSPSLTKKASLNDVPTITLKDYVVYPNTTSNVFISRLGSLNATKIAQENIDKSIFLICQRNAQQEVINKDDLYPIGTLCKIKKVFPMPNNRMNLFVEGIYRASLEKIAKYGSSKEDEYFASEITFLLDTKTDELPEDEIQSLRDNLLKEFRLYVDLIPHLSVNDLKIETIEDFSELTDNIAKHVNLLNTDRIAILAETNIKNRAEQLLFRLIEHNQSLIIEQNINKKSKSEITKHQKEFFLRQKLKIIQDELNSLRKEEGGLSESEPDKFLAMLHKLKMPKTNAEHIKNEIERYRNMPMQSQESGIIRNYIDWLLKLPWNKRKKLNYDLEKVVKILDENHYGLKEVKERIIEHLVIQKRTKTNSGMVLCLLGAPVVGKTSLAKSIAKATNRQFVRFALGGVRDEAEIRGHRRTYVAAMPGKIIQNMARAKANNPLFLLDEVDKIGADFRGDPASALLEVLDPEQNSMFNDHYLELDYDLSNVMFICTANTLDIPPALLDRFEIIRISGYTENEKLNIAKQHLWADQLVKHGVSSKELQIDDLAILSIIRLYTREAGIRELERQLEKLIRKATKELDMGLEKPPITFDKDKIHELLGASKHEYEIVSTKPQVGQVNGLAWTSTGGDVLIIEVTTTTGKGKLQFTGSLGKVFKESMDTAISYIRANYNFYGLDKEFFENLDIHIHVPSGAIPKDGPSAGLATVTAIVSALTNRPIKPLFAMTGEVTLKGNVLRIGGIKEKILAAIRSGIETVIIPMKNKPDLDEIDKDVLSAVNLRLVEKVEDAVSMCIDFTDLKTSIDLTRPNEELDHTLSLS